MKKNKNQKTFSMNRSKLFMSFLANHAHEIINRTEKILFYGKDIPKKNGEKLALMLINNRHTNNEIMLIIGKVNRKGFNGLSYVESQARGFNAPTYANLSQKEIISKINHFISESGHQIKKLPNPVFSGSRNKAFSY